MLTIGTDEASVTFGDVGGDREGSSVELINQEAVPAREFFGSSTDLIDSNWKAISRSRRRE